LRSRPNHTGSLASRLLTTVMNFCFFPRWISSTPICTSAGLRRAATHRSRYRRSIARTVLDARPNRRGICLNSRWFSTVDVSSHSQFYGAAMGERQHQAARVSDRGRRGGVHIAAKFSS
jgi:hypothetical protein